MFFGLFQTDFFYYTKLLEHLRHIFLLGVFGPVGGINLLTFSQSSLVKEGKWIFGIYVDILLLFLQSLDALFLLLNFAFFLRNN
jgi:hypothetical protein